MVEPRGELLNLSGLAVGANSAQYEQRAGAGIGKKEITVGSSADQPRHGEGATARRHHLLVVCALHGCGIAPGIERDFEAGGRERPRVGRAGNHMRGIVDSFIGIGFRQVGESDLAANARLLLIPVSECGLTGDGLLRGYCCWEKRCDCDEGDDRRESHNRVSRFQKDSGF